MRRAASIVIALISVMASIPSQPQATNTSAIEAVRQVEQAMRKAMAAGDVDKLNQIYADDFATFGSSFGKTITKKDLLSDCASFHDRRLSFELGSMDVQVFGNEVITYGPLDMQVFVPIALAQGSMKEKRGQNGNGTSGQFLWMDVLQQRAGKWVVWRSAGTDIVSVDSPNAQSQDPAVVAAIEKFENDLGDAMVASNLDKITQAYADDWETIGSSGEILSKEALLQDFKSGNHKLISFENGPINVRVLGDSALFQTSVTEKRIQDGKDISGLFAFMDLLEKRSGKWVIVRTFAAKVS